MTSRALPLFLLALAPVLKGQGEVQLPAPSNAIVDAARAQIGVTVAYDPAYVPLDYPGGDVPRYKGVCSDVVIRALRRGKGMDLQKLVHEDMKSHFMAYPAIWGLRRTDRNIDHRRVPNLRVYFQRKGYLLPPTRKSTNYQPGDVITCTVPPNRPHIMIVSNRRDRHGIPLVIHNIGRGTREEGALLRYPHTGHYRIR